MLTRTIAAVMLGFALFAGTATSAVAAPLTFNFTFAGNGATATGFIIFESTLLPNPGATIFVLPNPAVLDLQVTVSGATAGNGTFGIGTFSSIIWNTNGATLNLSAQLVGQPTPGSPWGTTTNGTSGDFNLFGTVAPAPRGTTQFTLGANFGAANSMVLTSMLQVVRAIPALDDLKLIVLALLVGGAGIVLVRRRSSGRAPG